MMLSRLCVTVVCALQVTMSSAHEFWIEPERWDYSAGETITAHLKNGELFQGTSLAWIDRNIARAEVAYPTGLIAMRGRMGDRPALQTQALDGLVVLLHETTPSVLTYNTWEKFQKFIDHKDLPVTQAAHLARGLPESGFTESYTRHAKALVDVGRGGGSDRAYGLETEFVLETDIYTDEFDGDAIVRLFYQGAPRIGAQVEVFERQTNGEVTVRLLATDDTGRVAVPVNAQHTYLLDAVVLRDSEREGAVYDTLWASLSFFVP